MSRSISTIEQSILDNIAADPILSVVCNSPSQTAGYRLLSYIVAVALGTEEGLNDIFQINVENVANSLPPGSLQWIYNNAMNIFQYSSTNPQIIQLSTTTFTPFYNVIDSTLRIIKNCSVSQGNLNSVNIKVAKAGPVILTAPELAALQSFFNNIKPAGIIYNCVSYNADQIKFGCKVSYVAARSGSISNDLLNAYNLYLNTLKFDGKIILLDLVIALRSVNGVIDVVINNAVIRPDVIPYGGGIISVNNNTWLVPEITTYAGYVKDETTSGQDFLSLLVLDPR